ncbi:MAG: molybdenum cofactor guanylyltransferase [Alphaproteobacteria bacterium]|nr:molybdenum cofactor guanylyltransferase [Alphaproteobacteria bacterium]MDE2043143.1 molybdenum cofactor guanylyltransferase [Alphaproteobacteria bacterium]MDE2340166.1 molybdenum cofactor guanylyltransferase [Alphaproteobacteria bacterium]
MILGCVLAGGQSRRFGRDKALAMLGSKTLLQRAVEQLLGWCDAVVITGRNTGPACTLPDWPHAFMGPLGGIAAALRYGATSGYDVVLSLGVDVAGLPDDLPMRLSPAPRFVESQPVIGLWPTATAPVLETLLESNEKHSMRTFIARLGAYGVRLPAEPANINTQSDLDAVLAASANISVCAKEPNHGL